MSMILKGDNQIYAEPISDQRLRQTAEQLSTCIQFGFSDLGSPVITWQADAAFTILVDLINEIKVNLTSGLQLELNNHIETELRKAGWIKTKCIESLPTDELDRQI